MLNSRARWTDAHEFRRTLVLHMRDSAIALLGKDVKSSEPAGRRLDGITATSRQEREVGHPRENISLSGSSSCSATTSASAAGSRGSSARRTVSRPERGLSSDGG